MEKRYYFESVNSISDLMCLILEDDENLKYIYKQSNEEEKIEEYINSINKISNTDKEKDFIKFVHYVDNKMNHPSEAEQNRMHKIPTILSYANLLANYDDKIKEYTLPERLLLAEYCYLSNDEEIKEIQKEYPKELLDYIVSKTNNYYEQREYVTFNLDNNRKYDVVEMMDIFNNMDLDYIREENGKNYRKVFEEKGDEIFK